MCQRVSGTGGEHVYVIAWCVCVPVCIFIASCLYGRMLCYTILCRSALRYTYLVQCVMLCYGNCGYVSERYLSSNY